MRSPRPILLVRDRNASIGGRRIGAVSVARRLEPLFGELLTVQMRGATTERSVLDRAREIDAGLIVAPAGRRQWDGEWQLLDDPGSRLMRRADRPVLLVPDDARWRSPPVFGVATDFSDRARAVVDWTLDLAEGVGARLLLIHAVEPPDPPVETSPDRTRELIHSAAWERAAEQLDGLASDLAARGRVELSTEIVDGRNPARALAAAASRAALCLLGLGRRGLTPKGDRLLGLTAEEILFCYAGPKAFVPARALEGRGVAAEAPGAPRRRPLTRPRVPGV